MAYRSIYVTDVYEMRIRNNQLLVNKDEKLITVPLEDISIILVEDQHALISTSLLGQLADYNIAVIFCDRKHMPSGIFFPMNNHYKQLKVFETQNQVKKPVLSQCWKKIVFYKILNQRTVLEQLKSNEYYVEYLDKLLKEIKSADNTNREGIAARVYFDGLFGSEFVRNQDSEDAINCALNYGYAILLANMTRLLAMYGFNTILGIHHESYVNNYNLACDMMEPFRPMIDRYVALNLDSIEYPLTTKIKKELMDVLHIPMRMNGANYLLEHAMEEMVLSLIKVYEENDSTVLSCPTLLEFQEIEEDE